MASEVDICNLALSHFGQRARISSIRPPDGSAEAEHCATFYPMARDQVLEEFAWTFAGKRATLAGLTNNRTDWAYRYAMPPDCLKARRLLPDGYSDSENDSATYEIEGANIYTNEANATLVYTFTLTDTTKFSPLALMAVSLRLASFVVGPIVKDPSGRVQSALYQRSLVEIGKAKVSDANSSHKRATHTSTAKGAR